MKPITASKMSPKNSNQTDDDNVRYKLNRDYFNNANKSPKAITKKQDFLPTEEENIRYKFPTVLIKPLSPPDRKPKPKPKIKVNFWSTNKAANKVRSNETVKGKTNHRHTIAAIAMSPRNAQAIKPKSPVVKLRKQVSFLPSPLFSENHNPMVTVPDDLTIQLNEEEANDLAKDLNLGYTNNAQKRKAVRSIAETSPKTSKRNRSAEDSSPRIHGNENELEYFSKYVVQKLRRMETNQRIYSENLINTVLMLGQLGKLHGKSKIGDA